MVHTIFLGKQRKRVYNIGPRRVYSIEASDPEKEKGGFHRGGVYFLLACNSLLQRGGGVTYRTFLRTSQHLLANSEKEILPF